MIAGTVGCAVLSLAFGFLYPKLTRVIIDDVIRKGRSDLLTPVAVLRLLVVSHCDVLTQLD